MKISNLTKSIKSTLSGKSSKNMSKILHNKMVLNIIAIIALFNVIGYINMGKTDLVLYFIALAVLTFYFTKNMIIVLGVPLLLVNLMGYKNYREGLENNTDTTQSVDSNIISDEKKEDIKDNKTAKDNTRPVKKTSQGLSMHNLDEETNRTNMKDHSSGDNIDNLAQSTVTEQQGFEPGRKKARGYEIDYATTIEDAYDELNKILGSDGIKRLTNDTQKLMNQQMQLANAMKGIQPVMESITPMVGQLTDMMNKMNINEDYIKKLNPNSSNKK